MRSLALVLVLFGSAAGCHSTPKADSPDANPPDAPIVSDAQTAPGCDLVQRNHATLPDREEVPFPYTAAFTICGSLDLLHSADDPGLAVDSSFGFDVPATTESILRFQADAPVDGFNTPGLAFYAEEDGYPIMTAPDRGFNLALIGSAGTTDIVSVYARYPATATTPINYKLTVEPYSFDQICPPIAGAAEYTEKNDGADSTGNDMTSFATATLVPAGASSQMLEKTGLTIAGGSAHKIHGTSGRVKADAAGMYDKDTYEITTGADADLLTVRTDPRVVGEIYFMFLLTTPDLKTYTFSGDTRNGPSIRAGIAVFKVAPSTTYWLQVFAATTQSSLALPVDYDLSVCGVTGSL